MPDERPIPTVNRQCGAVRVAALDERTLTALCDQCGEQLGARGKIILPATADDDPCAYTPRHDMLDTCLQSGMAG